MVRLVKLVCELCVLHDTLAPAERSYTGKLGVKRNQNGPNEKYLASLNMYRHDWSTPDWNDLFKSECTVWLFIQNEELCLDAEGTHLTVLVLESL